MRDHDQAAKDLDLLKEAMAACENTDRGTRPYVRHGAAERSRLNHLWRSTAIAGRTRASPRASAHASRGRGGHLVAHVALRRLRPKEVMTKSVANAIAIPSNITCSGFTNRAAAQPARSSWMQGTRSAPRCCMTDIRAKVSPSEDLRRMPGGFPHRMIGLVAFIAFIVVVFAAVLMAALLRGSVFLVVALAVTVPIVILLLARSATRNRSRVHPSR